MEFFNEKAAEMLVKYDIKTIQKSKTILAPLARDPRTNMKELSEITKDDNNSTSKEYQLQNKASFINNNPSESTNLLYLSNNTSVKNLENGI